MTEEIVKRTLDLVVLGFNAGSIEDFEKGIEKKKKLEEKSFKSGKKEFFQPPNGPQIPITYVISNDHLLKIKYSLMEQKLTITQDDYHGSNFDYDKDILDILPSILTLSAPTSFFAFGINYSTDILRDDRITLFNSNIDEQLGKDFWSTNIGFNTEIAFQVEDYISTYRIFKNEQLSNKENGRYYTFNVNYNFELKEDNNAEKIVDIFKKNKHYYDLYIEKMESILKL